MYMIYALEFYFLSFRCFEQVFPDKETGKYCSYERQAGDREKDESITRKEEEVNDIYCIFFTLLL